ncbi:MAG: YCF48-related protein [Ignavibacteriaceae bacterium]|nr:YCF48-related protein [Ignavibacteriaceae bacterium]
MVLPLVNLVQSSKQQIEELTGSYKTVLSSYIVFKVKSLSENIAFIIGEGATILKTTDGGVSWNQQANPAMTILYDVSFNDINTGTIVGNEGVILKTTDGGTNWVTQSSGTNNYLLGVSFADENKGIAVGDSGIIIKTIDGGTNWIKQMIVEQLKGFMMSTL